MYVKAHLMDWGTPASPCQPPPSGAWDAFKHNISQAGDNAFDGNELLPQGGDDEPEEG